MTLALHDRGLFTWDQWAITLSNCIKGAQESGDPDAGQTYYHHWLAALEQVTLSARVFSGQQLLARQEGWRHAAARTPHGHPIELSESERNLPES
ncbi:MAG: nitrile hydratase accessory protein [Burkholderiaceae bacterium]|nr:nitrile hydratase accessory protein [Burkholderiaceae bacterium]